MWIKVLRDYSYRVPTGRAMSVGYRKDKTYSVKRDWGQAMIRYGVAVTAPTPSKEARRARTKPPRP